MLPGQTAAAALARGGGTAVPHLLLNQAVVICVCDDLSKCAAQRSPCSWHCVPLLQVAEEILLNFFERFGRAFEGWEPDELNSTLAGTSRTIADLTPVCP